MITRSRRALPAILRPVARRRSEILGYHGVAEGAQQDPENLLLSPAAFRAQIELMLDAGFQFVTVSSLGDEVRAGAVAPGRIALSFDDGMEDNHHVVLPILREYGIPATIYVVTGLIGQPNPYLAGARMMTVEELREVAAHGVEIGAHTVSHPDLSTLGYQACLDEMTASRDRLAAVLGRRVETFAYPFCRYGPEAVAAARDAGFALAVTCERGRWTPYELRRSMVSSRDGLGRLAMKLAGVYEPVFTHRRRLMGAGGSRPRRRSGHAG